MTKWHALVLSALTSSAAGCGEADEKSAVSWVREMDRVSVDALVPGPGDTVILSGTIWRETGDADGGTETGTYLARVDAEGDLLWDATRWAQPFTSSSIAVGPEGTAYVLVGGNDGTELLWAVDEDGSTLWEARMTTEPFQSSVTTLGDQVIVATITGAEAVLLLDTQVFGDRGQPTTLLTRFTREGDAAGLPVALRGADLRAGPDGWLSGSVPSAGLPGWLEVPTPGAQPRCGVALRLGPSGLPEASHLDCAVAGLGRVMPFEGGIVMSRFQPERSTVALDDSLEFSWSVPLNGFASRSAEGVYVASTILYEISAEGRPRWQWPGSLAGGLPRTQPEGGFCNARIAGAGAELFVSTSPCRTAIDLLDAGVSTDFDGTLIARVRPEELPAHRSECGNGWLDPGEVCEAGIFGETSCSSLGEGDYGELRCTRCRSFDTSGCTSTPPE